MTLHLERMGFHVFNSRLRKSELVAAGEYEPYIISALMSARVLIVVGTNAENMNAQWVKNEWSRFQWLMKKEKEKTGHTDRILLCYLAGEMQPYDIPKGLNQHRQAITEGPSTDQQLKSVLAPLMKKEPEKPSGVQPSEETAESILTQMDIWLMTGHFKNVTDRYNQLIASGKLMKNPMLHLYALCAQKEVDEVDQLKKIGPALKDEGLFKIAVKFSKGTELETRLQSFVTKTEKPPVRRPAVKEVKAEESIEKKPQENAEELYQKALLQKNNNNYSAASVAFALAANQGHAESAYELCNCYYKGQGVDKDDAKAVFWCQKAADCGLPDAQNALGWHYSEGCGIERDEKRAVYWYQKAAEQGLAKSQNNLGNCYRDGRGVKRDEAKAIYWYKKAADQGHPLAEEALKKIEAQKKVDELLFSSAYRSRPISAARINGLDLFNVEIQDSWAEIINNIRNKSYRGVYQIGDTKQLDLGTEGVIEMQLVAFDEDTLADGSGKAPTTWIAKQLLKNDKRMNADAKKGLFSSEYKEGTGFIGGWEKTELRAYLKNTVLPHFPSEVSANIKTVKKYTGRMNTKGRVETDAVSFEDLWIPSRYEILGPNNKYFTTHETAGAQYSIFLEEKRALMRLKCRANASDPALWWTRTCSSAGYGSFGIVMSNKSDERYKDHFVYKEAGVCIGFCL